MKLKKKSILEAICILMVLSVLYLVTQVWPNTVPYIAVFLTILVVSVILSGVIIVYGVDAFYKIFGDKN